MDIDYGVLIGTTNDDIWNEFAEMSAGTRAIRKAMSPCMGPACNHTPRQHFQSAFSNVEHAKDACDTLAPFEHESVEDLHQRLLAWGRQNIAGLVGPDALREALLKAIARARGELPDFGVIRMAPDGVDFNAHEAPPEIRAIFERMMSDMDEDDDDPRIRH